MKLRPRHRRARQAGFSLTEALASVLILSVGLLGVAALQSRSLSGAVESTWRSAAVVASSDIAARLQANPVDYAQVEPADARCREAHFDHRHEPRDCSTTELAADDLADWQARIVATLPAGAGALRREAGGYRIDVSWDAPVGVQGVVSRQHLVTMVPR